MGVNNANDKNSQTYHLYQIVRSDMLVILVLRYNFPIIDIGNVGGWNIVGHLTST